MVTFFIYIYPNYHLMKAPRLKYQDGGKTKKSIDYSKSKEVQETEESLLKKGYAKGQDEQGNIHYYKQSETPGNNTPPKKKITTPPSIKPKAQGTSTPPKKITTPPTQKPPMDSQEVVHLKPPVLPKTPALNTDIQTRTDKKLLPSTNPKFDTYQYPDTKGGGGWGSPITKYYDKKTGQEIHSNTLNEYGKSGTYTPQFIPNSFVNTGANVGSTSLMSNDVNKNSVDVQQANSKNAPIISGNQQSQNAIPGVTTDPLLDKSSQGIGEGFIPKEKLPTTVLPKKNGGKLIAPKRKKYADGGTTKTPQEIENEQKARALGNTAGNALGQYGSQYYSQNQGTTDEENIRANALGTIGKSGAIGGAVSGLAGIGDSIGKPIQQKSDKLDANGNVIDTKKSQQNATIGAILSPSKALAERMQSGDWTSLPGKEHTNFLEKKAQKKINDANAVNAQVSEQDAISKRNAGQTSTQGVGLFNSGQNKFDKDGNLITENGMQFAEGGTIKGAGTGKSDSIKANIKNDSFIVPEENNHIAKMIRAKILGDNPNKVAKTKQKNGIGVKVSNGEHLFNPKEVKEIESELGEEFLESLAPNADEESHERANGGKLSKTKAKEILTDGTANGKALTDKQKRYFGWVAGGSKNNGGAVQELKNGGKPKTKVVDTVPTKNLDSSALTSQANKSLEEDLNNKSNAIDATPIIPEKTTPPKTKSKVWDNILNASKGISNSGALGAVGDYAMAGFQIGKATKELNKLNRPVYKLDSTFNSNVDTAQNNAKFGFTPEQKFALDQNNQNLLNDARFDARNLSGGNAGAAFNNERMAINDAQSRALNNQIADNQLKLSKFNTAIDTSAQRSIMNRQIFEDSLDAFNLKSQANSNLLSAGMTNALQANRMAQFLKMRKQEQDINNSYQ